MKEVVVDDNDDDSEDELLFAVDDNKLFVGIDDEDVDVLTLAPDDLVPIIETFVLFAPGRAGKSSELIVNSLCALSRDDDADDWLIMLLFDDVRVELLSLAILT